MGGPGSGSQENFKDRHWLTVFAKDRQPDEEQRKKGWLKRKKGRDAVKALLELDMPKSEATQIVAKYLGIEESEISVEIMMHAVQIAKSIQKGDTFSYSSVVERAYGKPKDVGPDEDIEAPAIVIQPVVTMQEAPPISEEEPKEDGGLMPS